MEHLTGKTVAGRYRLGSVLGAGGMGTIFPAEDRLTGGTVVVKNLTAFKKTDVNIQRFRKEAEILKKLKHPNIVTFIDFLTWEDELFIILEYLRGVSLQTKLSPREPMEIGNITNMLFQVLSALETAHSHRIVHRDLKPSNIFCIPQGKSPDLVKLLDFGISISMEEGPEMRLTRTGEIVGTPYYLSPEHITRDREISYASDIYSLGVILYEALAGFPPFSGKNDMDVLMGHLYRQPNPIRRPGLEKDPDFQKLVRLTHRCLKKNIRERPGSIREIREFMNSDDQIPSQRKGNIINDRVTRHRESFQKPPKITARGETTKKMEFHPGLPDETLGIPPLFKSDTWIALFEEGKDSMENSLIPMMNISHFRFRVLSEISDSLTEESHLPSLFILNESGEAILEKLKKIRSSGELKHLPVISCGDENDIQLITSAIEAGATDHFTTPIDPDVISAKLKKYTGGPDN